MRISQPCELYLLVVYPGQWCNSRFLNLIVSQYHYIQVVGLIENSLRDFLNHIVLQVKFLEHKHKTSS